MVYIGGTGEFCKNCGTFISKRRRPYRNKEHTFCDLWCFEVWTDEEGNGVFLESTEVAHGQNSLR